MATGKAFRNVRKVLESLGYEITGTSGAGSYSVFTRDGSDPISVNPSVADHAARHLITKVQKAHKAFVAPPKRNATAVKERRAGDRKRAAAEEARHQAELDRLVAMREAEFAAHLSRAERKRLFDRIEAHERELRYWRSLMTETPANNAHSGRVSAQHRS